MNSERKKLRPVAVHSHQVYWVGWFHCFATIDGKTMALIEGDDGKVARVCLDYHHLEFKD